MTRTDDTAVPSVLSIDQGTTNSKAVLVDRSGRVLGATTTPVGIAHPRPGWVEQDAEELWTSVLTAVDACLAAAPTARPVAVAVTNQRESVVAWSRGDGRPLGPVLGWQDARTTAHCAALLEAGLDEIVRRRTGLAVDAMFSAPKMRWLLDHAVGNGADPADVCLGTVESWLVWRLTGGSVFAAEAGNAARTLLFDLVTCDWHDELTDAFGIPRVCLGEIRRSDGGFGTTVPAGRLSAGLPIAAVLPDSSAALYAHGATRAGAGKVTYGTGSSVMAPSPAAAPAAPPGISTTLAWHGVDGPTLAREGNVLATGQALDWMAGILGAAAGSAGGDYLDRLARDVSDTGGTALVPAFSGLGAPHWDRGATGVLVGLTAATSRAHLARAALESVAHQVADVVDAMESDGALRLDVVHADGGASASRLLMQLQADVLGRPVSVAASAEASAVGAALMAGRALGIADGPDGHAGSATVVQPSTSDDERARARNAWADALARSRSRHDRHDAPTPVPDPPTRPAPARAQTDRR